MMHNHITSYSVSQVSKILAEPISLAAHNFLVEIISPMEPEVYKGIKKHFCSIST